MDTSKQQRKPRVFVVNASTHDFSDARRFGELVFLTNHQVHRLAVADMARQMYHAIADSHSGDMLLCTSLVQMNLVACCLLLTMHRKVNLLIFHDGRYHKRTIVPENLFKNPLPLFPDGPFSSEDESGLDTTYPNNADGNV